ncbi:MAG: hypothetical protein KGM15_17960 [Pseudomonadota bacterium]|nr:hypothetical protein [Pseudomonadota bacterium]
MAWLLPETDSVAIGLRLFIDFLGILAALATGRSFASSWSPLPLVLPAMAALAGGVHFLHYSLFEEVLLSPYYYGATFVVLLIFAVLGYRAKRALQMGTQYRWMFHNEGMFWRERARN